MKHVSYSNIVWFCVLVVVVVFVNTSCQPDTKCREDISVGMVCEFRRPYKDNGQTKMLTTWDSITVQGIGKDEPLYNNAKSVKKIQLPLRYNEDSTQYTLVFVGKKDTLTIYHNNIQKFASVECGCYFEHQLLGAHATNHWIDSVEIVADTITRSGSSNIYLWRTR